MALPKFWAWDLARNGHWAGPHQSWAQKDCPKSVEDLEHHSTTEIASAAREGANGLLVHISDGTELGEERSPYISLRDV